VGNCIKENVDEEVVVVDKNHTIKKELTKNLVTELVDIFSKFSEIVKTNNLANFQNNIKNFIFNGYLERVFVGLIERNNNSFWDMVAPGYVESTIQDLFIQEKYELYITITCIDIEQLLHTKLSILISKGIYRVGNGLSKEQLQKFENSNLTLNDYSDINRFIDGKQVFFIDEVSYVNRSLFKQILLRDGLNIRNSYLHGNILEKAYPRYDAYMVMCIYTNLIGYQFLDQYLEYEVGNII
jgi:hypothetical protein